ncbi:MAG: 1-acyl-sn-glycerol-3-phosphate acyltransferase [Bacteroidota bacterium]
MLRILYPGTEVIGLSHAKMKGPFIVASNHPNTLMDPLFSGIFLDERLFFLAHAGLFQNKWLAGFLSFAGVVPIARAKDRAAGMEVDNDASFSQAIELLRNGGCFFIAPEGDSELELKLRPLKSGLARIALSVENNQNWSLGLQILPVALNYESPTTAFSRALIRYVEPIQVSDWKAAYQSDASRAVKDLTRELDKRMRSNLIDTKDKEEEKLLLTLTRIYANDKPTSPLEQNRRTRKILDALRQMPTDQREQLEAKATQYATDLRKSKLIDLSLSDHPNRKLSLGNLLGFPIFLWGLVNHLPILVLASLAERLSKIIPNYLATLRGLVGWLALAICYIFQMWLVAKNSSALWSWLYLLQLPVIGLIALAYWTTYRPSFASLHKYKAKDDLLQQRKHLRSAAAELLQ